MIDVGNGMSEIDISKEFVHQEACRCGMQIIAPTTIITVLSVTARIVAFKLYSCVPYVKRIY